MASLLDGPEITAPRMSMQWISRTMINRAKELDDAEHRDIHDRTTLPTGMINFETGDIETRFLSDRAERGSCDLSISL